ncbi:RNA 2',3'-cyclic phosphodiesterase [Altererythrobacter indicus]|uniref:RNA 2',3'-cyclic phosphodiesterase n=1 Tax=Altericroceibacterium indicum TaxID=374177 RepID=A0A845A594_9SPHN|nr:RNA 2',3'-cyclic phosphodiesterase [Altericroceibacterium indicum]
MIHRLFIGISPPDWLKSQLIATMDGVEGARWQNEKQLHLTLRFVGDVDTALADRLAKALEEVCSGCPAFPLAMEGAGTFEKNNQAQMLWAGVSHSPELIALQKRVEQICQMVGLEADTRVFVPHITLARLNSSSGPVQPFLDRNADLSSEVYRVERIILYESHLSQTGSIYKEVKHYPLL